ncbi:hypothetical protein GGTG_11304 [Gaeumannomyces tritici R3-111a-1]|uniref:Uncharacterized protein n=1 Tax=Gaeumannomyces tritici (strain R3-111a-1) TaxID=644352 RepID=J3PCT6_GAET3|nr:hypothetical protein GGTG_11304 [Gaeumannomyces tritici R3-111a-1]EJT72056.1 hypothetical protein GGTG_11304 [Gaeumannomyces tritici R3-111a-1]
MTGVWEERTECTAGSDSPQDGDDVCGICCDSGRAAGWNLLSERLAAGSEQLWTAGRSNCWEVPGGGGEDREGPRSLLYFAEGLLEVGKGHQRAPAPLVPRFWGSTRAGPWARPAAAGRPKELREDGAGEGSTPRCWDVDDHEVAGNPKLGRAGWRMRVPARQDQGAGTGPVQSSALHTACPAIAIQLPCTEIRCGVALPSEQVMSAAAGQGASAGAL